ncbi:hypothetical protein B0O99DRAFT_618984 [Bisporella sp. PMI_857]|nr:hypothetical protein B0O99DRAFT_618984 [Bisporella sp. PMI_857]
MRYIFLFGGPYLGQLDRLRGLVWLSGLAPLSELLAHRRSMQKTPPIPKDLRPVIQGASKGIRPTRWRATSC